MLHDQLPFPMDCLYADPERKVIIHIQVLHPLVLLSLLWQALKDVLYFRLMMSWAYTMVLDVHSSIRLV
jgi:hypothetical protein